MYIAHPSASLTSLFARKPYQGANPREADFLFVGLDANYDAEIEHRDIFGKVREYHEDGVRFWRQYGVHHPFLLPQYRGDGQFYHRSFARIGFRPGQAHRVSFIELLHVPTVGRNKLVPADLSGSHLTKLNDVLLHGSAKHIFIPRGVARLMHATKAFDWLPKPDTIVCRRIPDCGAGGGRARNRGESLPGIEPADVRRARDRRQAQATVDAARRLTVQVNRDS